MVEQSPNELSGLTDECPGRPLRAALGDMIEPRLVNARARLRHIVGIKRWYRVFRALKIRNQIVRCTAGEALDARILHDRLVELNERYAKHCCAPAVILSRILSG